MELIIAMGVIIVGLLTVVGLIARSISVGALSKNEVIALGLAQEGIEAVRAIRDSNGLEIEAGKRPASEWNFNLSKSIGANTFDYTGIPWVTYDFEANPADLVRSVWVIEFGGGGTTINSLDDEATRVLRYEEGQPDAGLFFQDGSAPQGGVKEDTGFRRLVSLEPICDVGGVPTLLGAPDLSNAGGCASQTMGYRIYSTVRWKDQVKETPEEITLTHDIYNWR